MGRFSECVELSPRDLWKLVPFQFALKEALALWKQLWDEPFLEGLLQNFQPYLHKQDSKAIAATLVAHLTTLFLLPNRIQTLPGFLPFSEWPVVFWQMNAIASPRAVITLAGVGPRLGNVILRRGSCTGSFWKTFPSPSARRPAREEVLSASRCCHKAVAPVAPSEDEADRWDGHYLVEIMVLLY